MLALSWGLAACGFHLRGAPDLPAGMAVTYLDIATPTSDLALQLKRTLETAGITVIFEPAEGAAVLKVSPSSGRRTLSIGPDGKALEYEVYYTVRFAVSKPGSEFEIAPQQVTLTRDFVYDPLAVLAVGKEQARLEQDMERELARLIIQRIAAVGASGDFVSPPPVESPAE